MCIYIYIRIYILHICRSIYKNIHTFIYLYMYICIYMLNDATFLGLYSRSLLHKYILVSLDTLEQKNC